MSESDANENGKSFAELDEPAGVESGDTLAAAVEQRDRLAEEKAELLEVLQRRQADHENFRKRAERERGEIFDRASMEAAGALLPVLDDFERALKAAPAEDGPLRDYATGMQLIYQRLWDILTRMGLEPLGAEGKPFDPNLHHAVQKEERDDCEDHTVLEEMQKGYLFRGRLLRAAMVKVSVKP